MQIYFLPIDVYGKGYYRMFLPSKYLHVYIPCIIKHNTYFEDKDLQESDVIVNQHHHTNKAIEYFKQRLSKGTIVITDIDDDYWSISEANPAKVYWDRERLNRLAEVLRISTAVTVPTHNLREVVSQFNKNVYIIPNYIEMPVLNKKAEKSKRRIIWGGSSSHVGDFSDCIVSALLEIYKKHKDIIDLIFVGYIPPKLKGKAYFYSSVTATDYVNFISSLNADIAIAPLENNLFNKSKSPLKYCEYSAIKAVTIASDVDVYRNSIPPFAGVLVKNQKENWVTALLELIFDATTMNTISKNAFDYVSKNYWIRNNILNTLNTYKTIVAKANFKKVLD